MTKQEEKEAYEAYLDRLSMMGCPVSISKEENEKYNKEHPLPTENEIMRILKEAGY